MLCISRFEGEVVCIGPDVRMTLTGIRTTAGRLTARLGFEAPRHIQIDREEIYVSKGGTLWQGPPAGVFVDGWLCEDKHGVILSVEAPVWAAQADCWVSITGRAVQDVVAWKFPAGLPYEKRCIKVGPEAEKGIPCFKS
jgi:carbon storage regulator CsrA